MKEILEISLNFSVIINSKINSKGVIYPEVFEIINNLSKTAKICFIESTFNYVYKKEGIRLSEILSENIIDYDNLNKILTEDKMKNILSFLSSSYKHKYDFEFKENDFVKCINKTFKLTRSDDYFYYDKDNTPYRKIYCDPASNTDIRKYKISLL